MRLSPRGEVITTLNRRLQEQEHDLVEMTRLILQNQGPDGGAEAAEQSLVRYPTAGAELAA